MNNIPSVDIIIRTYFRKKALSKTLESIANLNYLKNKIRIIVVKDSRDQDAEKVIKAFEQKYPEIRTLLLEITINSTTKGWNLGIKHSDSEIIAVAPDDVIIHQEAVSYATNLLQTESKIVAVTFPFLFESQTIWTEVAHMKFINTLTTNTFSVLALTFYRKSVLEKIGLYREDMGPPLTIHEDWELGSRLRKHGYKIIVNGMITMKHIKELANNKEKMLSIREENRADHGKKLWLLHIIMNYIKSYIHKHWWSMLQVFKVSPLIQLIEYAFYLANPLIFLVLLYIGPLYALIYTTIVTTFVILWNLLNGYYQALNLKKRVTYPLLLFAIRSMRAYLFITGLIINKLGIIKK